MTGPCDYPSGDREPIIDPPNVCNVFTTGLRLNQLPVAARALLANSNLASSPPRHEH
jgi:hypothetical protein